MQIKYNDKDDTFLLQSYCNDGNKECLGILLQRYTGLLFGVCMKYLKDEENAKDAVQQIFLKVINELAKYKVAYFKSWLYMIAKNHCLMQFRNKNKSTIEIKENLFASENDETIKEQILHKENSLTALEQALLLLNNEQRICVTLFYLEKKSYQEIVTISNYNLLQVKSNIQNGKRNLKILMQRITNT
ncbi:MAG: sigma-70 family RNA polymerase sigma factor [Ferruginibacter sp.]|nr:sigma-70 family RNA polymerase sigma factor [Ferruginibacter sp.]